MKRISADGSVGFPHVRVGHCQVPLKETRLTAGFLRLEETKKWGQSTLIPIPQQSIKMGSEYFITQILRTKSKYPYPPAKKSKRNVLRPQH